MTRGASIFWATLTIVLGFMVASFLAGRSNVCTASGSRESQTRPQTAATMQRPTRLQSVRRLPPVTDASLGPNAPRSGSLNTCSPGPNTDGQRAVPALRITGSDLDVAKAPLPSMPPPQLPADYPEPASLLDDGWVPALPGLQESPVVRHKVRDGDTLEKLAEIYLGDPGRYMEIFEANRDVLTRPDLLPIGIELVIPVATGRK